MRATALWGVLLVGGMVVAAATEEPIDERFRPIQPDPAMGDWQGSPGYVAEVVPITEGRYRVDILQRFDAPGARPLAVMAGPLAALSGDGWNGAIADGHLRASSGTSHLDLEHVARPAPKLGLPPPKGAIVLFDGNGLEAWAKKKGKDWLTEDGPARWKILPDGVLEVVPGSDCIITHRKFGDGHVHVEFRTLGAPTNSGVYLQTRYEVNINETYGRYDETPCGALDNCTPASARLQVRAARPPLEWQTLDIEFRAPRFDASGNRTEPARATVWLNGVRLYDEQPLQRPKGAAGRLGEAPTGPLMLQEHGMPVQFRNIWFAPAPEQGRDRADPAP